MEAKIGDRLHVHSNTVGARDRVAEIIEVRGHGRRAALPRPLPGRPREPGLPRPRLRDRAGRAAHPRMDLAALRTPSGAAALAAAAEVAGGDPLAAAAGPARGRRAARPRGRRADPGRAAPPGGRPSSARTAAGMFFTRAGLEQATRSVVADAPGGPAAPRPACARSPTSGCGLGADAIASARAGIRVYGVEADPTTAALAAANAGRLRRRRPLSGELAPTPTAFDIGRRATRCSATRPAAGRQAGGCSTRPPTRRPGTSWPGWPRGCRTRWSRWRPGSTTPWRRPAPRWSWSASTGEVVEAALWCGAAGAVPRRATVRARRGRRAS